VAQASSTCSNFGVTWYINKIIRLVGDDPRQPDDGGEIPKSQGRGWQFNPQLCNLLCSSHKVCQVVDYFMYFGVGLSASCLRKIKKIKFFMLPHCLCHVLSMFKIEVFNAFQMGFGAS
jgi:hypothetical protein